MELRQGLPGGRHWDFEALFMINKAAQVATGRNRPGELQQTDRRTNQNPKDRKGALDQLGTLNLGQKMINEEFAKHRGGADSQLKCLCFKQVCLPFRQKEGNLHDRAGRGGFHHFWLLFGHFWTNLLTPLTWIFLGKTKRTRELAFRNTDHRNIKSFNECGGVRTATLSYQGKSDAVMLFSRDFRKP